MLYYPGELSDVPLLPHWPAWRVIISLWKAISISSGTQKKSKHSGGQGSVPGHVVLDMEVVEVIATRDGCGELFVGA